MNRRDFLAAAALLAAGPVARPVLAQDEELEPPGEPEAPLLPPQILEVRKIWDYAAHNAFTSLAWFNGEWFCTFREANKHVSPDGGIRVLRSADGCNTFHSVARLADPAADLRDPKLSVTPDRRLMINAAAATPGAKVRHRSKVWFSENGRDWSEPHTVGDDDFWLWRATWHDGTAYGVGYLTAVDRSTRFARLYKSADGVKWETLVDQFVTEGSPNESSLVFDADGTARCLVRREEGTKTALLGVAKPPYTDWTWHDLHRRIGGPAMVRMKDGRLIAVVRLYDEGEVRTSVCEVLEPGRKVQAADGEVVEEDVEVDPDLALQPQGAGLVELFALPSGGDTSYAGVVEHQGLLWVSYYSSHEKKSAIYFAKLDLNRTAHPEPSTSFYGY